MLLKSNKLDDLYSSILDFKLLSCTELLYLKS